MNMILSDLRRAFGFLTILPMGGQTAGKPGRIFAYFPLVGLVIGLASAGVASLSFLPADLRAFLAMLTWVVLTGGLHLDGFADCCDGLLPQVVPERRLEILKDVHAGSWAIVGLILLLLGKWIAIRNLASAALILPPIAGRWAMVLAAWYFPSARPGGTGAYFRDGLGRWETALASGIAVMLLALDGWRGVLLGGVVLVVVFGGGHWASRRLGGGLTGDVYGALCELTELLCLWALW